MSEWAGSVSQVLSGRGVPVGAGFLTAGGVLVTCAHVVLDAGGDVGGLVRLRFPRAEGVPEVVGRVLAQGWQPPQGQDIALISLVPGVPDGVRPLPLADSASRRGHPVRAFGFPAQAGPDGHFGGGRAGDLLQPSLLQLSEASDLTAGFSGGPVWDEQDAAVIGMVTKVIRADQLGKGAGIAYATSTAALRAAWPALSVAEVCPYRGIEPFGTEHAGLFHGRDRAVRTVVDVLAGRPPVVLLLGPSGSGKSSLIRAGVLPRLAAGDLPGSRQWSIAVLRPGPALPAGHDLLVVDQFEEVFTQPGQVVALTDRIAAIARPGRTVLLVMRDDFYARLAAEAPGLLEPAGSDGSRPAVVNIPATLGRDELRDIIVAPAEAARARLQDGLADRIVDDVLAGKPRAGTTVLPLLQVALTQLWRNRSDGVLTRRAYDDADGLSGSITTWCDQVIGGLPEPVTRTVLTLLVQPASTGPDGKTPAVRRQRRLAKLHEAAGDDSTVVARLVDGHVVVTSAAEPDGEPVADLAHDALIDRWYTLRHWVEQDADYQKWLHRAEQKQRQWARQAIPDPADLLSGHDLTEGQQWSAQYRLPAEVAAFLAASTDRQQASARTARRRTRVLAGLLAVMLIVAGTAIWQWRTATTASRLALSGQLAAQSTALLPSTPDVADLLAVKAYRTRPTSEAVDSLHNAVTQPIVSILTGHTSGVSGVAYSPDGTHLATAGADATVRVWDLTSGGSRTLTGHTEPVSAVAYSPDGTHLATAAGGTVRVWDLAGGGSRTLTGHTDTVRAVAYSPDGKHLATAGDDSTVRVWDLASGGSRTLTGHTSPVSAVAYSPDGTHLATAGYDSTVRVRDLASGGSRTLTGHTSGVSGVAYSPDGKHLATAGYDRTVRVWDLTSGGSRTLTGHTDSVFAVAYSPDGKHLATASGDRTVRVWTGAGMMPQEMISLICNGLVRRDLTPDEYARYLPSTDTSPVACPAAR